MPDEQIRVAVDVRPGLLDELLRDGLIRDGFHVVPSADGDHPVRVDVMITTDRVPPWVEAEVVVRLPDSSRGSGATIVHTRHGHEFVQILNPAQLSALIRRVGARVPR